MPGLTIKSFKMYDHEQTPRAIAIKIAEMENIPFDPDTTEPYGPLSSKLEPFNQFVSFPRMLTQLDNFKIENHTFTIYRSKDTNPDGTRTYTYKRC